MIRGSVARRGSAVALALLLGFWLPRAVDARTDRCLIVNTRLDLESSSLQAAVDGAASGDTIRVTGRCIGSTTVDKSLTIVGKSNPGHGPATLDGNGTGRVVTIGYRVEVLMSGLIITNGSATWGGGISTALNWGEPGPLPVLTLVDSTVSGNSATFGGGIANEVGKLTLVDTTVVGNTASADGGGIYNSRDGADLVIRGSSSVTGNHAGQVGGGIYAQNHGTVTLSDSSSVDHNSALDAAGIVIHDTEVSLSGGSSIHDNVATGDGGGVWIAGTPGVLHLHDSSSVRDNTATNGGGIFSRFGAYVIIEDGTEIAANVATVDGGGVYHFDMSSEVVLRDSSTIHGNIAGRWGGGVFGGRVGVFDDGAVTHNVPDDCYPAGTLGDC